MYPVADNSESEAFLLRMWRGRAMTYGLPCKHLKGSEGQFGLWSLS